MARLRAQNYRGRCIESLLVLADELVEAVLLKHGPKYHLRRGPAQGSPDQVGIAIPVWRVGRSHKKRYVCFSGREVLLNTGDKLPALVSFRLKQTLKGMLN